MGAILYLPASQLVHEEPASEYVPARQFMQAVEDVDPEGDDFPAGQLVQAAALVWPSSAENLPAAQGVQTVSAAPEYVPAWQAVHAAEPSMLHFASKPGNVKPPSDVKVICRKPVVDVYSALKKSG
jgi:hypothetical protein